MMLSTRLLIKKAQIRIPSTKTTKHNKAICNLDGPRKHKKWMDYIKDTKI